jgi:hypothetical protein
MFSYDIVEQVEQTNVPLASFSAPWALSVPIFHDVAAAYFAARQPGVARALLLYATLEDDDGPDRRALVCSAHFVADDGKGRMELRSGPLLEAALRARRH